MNISNSKTILILFHRPEPEMSYDIEHYAVRWVNAGHRVLYHVGPEGVPEADITLLHINLSVLPKPYLDLAKTRPMVLNAGIPDISRRCFSQLLLDRNDSYSGKVIVKTNANHGGFPELLDAGIPHDAVSIPGEDRPGFRTLLERLPFIGKPHAPRTGSRSADWSTIETLNPRMYPVFNNLKSVPRGVWNNDKLVVERFIHSPEDEFYQVYYYIFFGDKEIAGRLSSANPVVKFGNAVSDEELPVSDTVRNWRKELNADYGRFDYVISDGCEYLIDVNKTEKGGGMNYAYSEYLDYLASGIEVYLS